MKYLYASICLLFILLVSCNNGNNATMSELYNQIDDAIANDKQNVDKREADIASLKQQLTHVNGTKKYAISDSIFQNYTSYDNDSAVAWAMRSYNIAKEIGDSVLVAKSKLNLVEQYTKSGYFTDASRYFHSINHSDLPGNLLPRYYDVGSDLYGNSGYSAEDPAIKQNYWKISEKLRDSLYDIVQPNTYLYFRNRIQEAINKHIPDDALMLSGQWLKNTKAGTHEYAIVAYYRSEAYRIAKDTLGQKEWLARSAVADISNAVMDQASLWMLAGIIYNEGDIDRAYKYMDYSWQCVSRFSTHKRGWDITPILTVIDNTYQARMQTSNRRLTILIIITIFFLATSLCLLHYVQRKRTQLSEAQKALAESNRQLKATIEELHQTNAELHEADRVKDKYIGQFFVIYSKYIDKLNAFRAKVRRKLKAGLKSDIMEMTNPDALSADEHKELMNNFDDVFLSLYPTFVDDFNALLKPDCKIRPVGKDKMNTTLRIFALIRLGINESSRIADILGYSPNSIYNYRTRAKNMAACPRDEFEDRIKTVKPS